MKKFFKVLLLAAVALMPVMGMAQNLDSSQAKWEREMRMRQYEDSVASARQAQLDKHAREMASIEQQAQITKMRAIWNEDLWLLFVFAGGTITIVVLCLRHSRRKAEDHKELINKLIDNNLLNSTEPISKETIEALMKPNKTEKERFIGDATLLGLGIGLFVGARALRGGPDDLLSFAGMTLAGLGLLRLFIRTVATVTGPYLFQGRRRNAKREQETRPIEEAVRKQRTDIVQEAEVIEEK